MGGGSNAIGLFHPLIGDDIEPRALARQAALAISHTFDRWLCQSGSLDAPHRAHHCDPVSAFGGIVSANRVVTGDMANELVDVFTYPWTRQLLEEIRGTQTEAFSGLLSALYAGDGLLAMARA